MGEILLVSDGTALTGLYFDGGRHKEMIESMKTGSCPALPVFASTCQWLDIYFRGEVPDFAPELSLEGTAFQKRVWEILKEIPYGQTITYGEIAARIAAEQGIARMSARAVGGAVGSNPVSIIVPCHRVVGANGNLTGYGGGMDKKVALLTLEGVDMGRFHTPHQSSK
ncbi:MAG: methylated-DNA--[protein]-cysteine S-methyltransferase [Clostridiales bacterium]|nr:methylated-DNA--[protein]-cysteine S-methyltransferase [Clostridiales bacterium]